MLHFDIQHFASDSDQKAAVVERFNRTIKTRLWTYMSDKGTVRWVDVLQKLVVLYNYSYYRSIGMAPADVTMKNKNRIWARLYGDGDTHLKQKALPVSAMLRINKSKGVFDKGYMPNVSKEHFTVEEAPAAHNGSKRRVYKISDYNGEPVSGTWYDEELRHITNNQYRIERVIRRRTAADGRKEILVKWESWPEKFNSWIREKDHYNASG